MHIEQKTEEWIRRSCEEIRKEGDQYDKAGQHSLAVRFYDRADAIELAAFRVANGCPMKGDKDTLKPFLS